MKHVGAVEWAQEEFRSVELDDGRWKTRLFGVAARVAKRPGGKVSDVFRNDAERQGAYGLLESGRVAASEVGLAMFKATARRCAREKFVFCAVDGSSLTLTDREKTKPFGPIGTRSQGGRGLKVINALAMSPGGVPLGLTSQVWWTRPKRGRKKHRDKLKPAGKEIGRWLDAMEQSRQMLKSEKPKATRLWFQLDREADAWPILQQAGKDGHWFTIRGSHNRRVKSERAEKTYLRDVLAREPVMKRYDLPVSAGRRRTERTAAMAIRSCTTTLDFRDKSTGRRWPMTVNVVCAREEKTTPKGEKPIEWLLLTNRPVTAQKHLDEIILGYAQRWKIEEFHRTWKSGACSVEDTQLRSMESVVKWATILAAVAVRIERIKFLSREEPTRPASDEFSPIELRAITLLRFGKKGPKSSPAAAAPTLAEVTLWVAQLGGYTGKSSGGPPGSIVLARGLQEVSAAVRTLEALG
jgi:hypothetical protein